MRVEAYDHSGNRGVAEKVNSRSSAFRFTGFTATSYSVPMNTAASLAWTVSLPDGFRIYNILIRPQGGTTWTPAVTATGSAHLLDTSLLSGTQEVRAQSGGVTRDLPLSLVIRGTGLRSSMRGSVRLPARRMWWRGAPLLRLNWASNQPEFPVVPDIVPGRWDGTVSFAILGGTTEKSLEVNTGTNTALEWKVLAQWEGQEFTSAVRFTRWRPWRAVRCR